MIQHSISSGEQAGATTVVITGPAAMSGLQVCTDGINAAKVIIDDSVDGTGTVKCEMTVVGANHYGGRNWTRPIEFTAGIYVTLSGSGGSYFVETCSP